MNNKTPKKVAYAKFLKDTKSMKAEGMSEHKIAKHYELTVGDLRTALFHAAAFMHKS